MSKHTPFVPTRTPVVRTRAGRACVLTAALVLASMFGCGGGGTDPGAGGGSFIAFPRDFEGFKSWTMFDLGDDQTDGLPVVGRRRAYLNKVPPHGSTSFPVGTVIIKTIGEEEPMPGQTFAMAKRGEPFNMLGALGWEWFELVEAANAAPVIKWRGITPPAGETYAGIMGGACNTCHALDNVNDFVPSP